MTDIDTLQGQALADAVAIEVMGWEGRDEPAEFGGHAYWYSKADDGFVAVDAWRPDEKWGNHIGLFVRVHELGIETRGEWSREGSEWSIWERGRHLARQFGPDYRLTFCLATLKAVRERGVTG